MAALDLRPLSLGELLDRTFFLYRRHFLLFVGIAAIPYSFFFVINLATALAPVLAAAAGSGRCIPRGSPRRRLAAEFSLLSRPSRDLWRFFFPLGRRSSPFPRSTRGARRRSAASLRRFAARPERFLACCF